MSGPGLQNLPPSDPRWPALNLVRPPAFLLLAVGTLNVIFSIVLVVFAFGRIPVIGSTPDNPVYLEPTTGFLLGTAASLVCAGVTIWGALNAMRLRGYAIALMGALTALFPMSPSCVVAVLISPWMLFTLSRQEVRKVFSP